jgi:hypothetical protein
LEDIDMIDIKRPIELAGMRARPARAKKLEGDFAVIGKRYDTVLGAIISTPRCKSMSASSKTKRASSTSSSPPWPPGATATQTMARAP